MLTRDLNILPSITEENLDPLTSHQMIDMLSVKTIELLAALHQKNNRANALILKREVERIQVAIRQKKSLGL